MRCPYCNHPESKVIDSRDAAEGVRRRRECIQCGLRFTTYERIQTTALMVAKRDGRREEYNRDKLTNSVQRACVKRPLPTGTIDKLVDDIESHLQGLGRAEIPSVAIGEMVMERLRTMDPVAYIRFASVYRDFADVESFKEAVEALDDARVGRCWSSTGFVPEEGVVMLWAVSIGRTRYGEIFYIAKSRNAAFVEGRKWLGNRFDPSDDIMSFRDGTYEGLRMKHGDSVYAPYEGRAGKVSRREAQVLAIK